MIRARALRGTAAGAVVFACGVVGALSIAPPPSGEGVGVGVVVPPPPVVELAAPAAVRPADPYAGLQHDLEQLRATLAAQRAGGADVRDPAREALAAYLPKLMEQWIGTAYAFTGASEVPREGAIACGYFVSTILLHAGLQVERVDLARQPAEQILRTVVPDADLVRLSRASRAEVVDVVAAQGAGIYLVGLDTHVGFLLHDGQAVSFCHASSRWGRGVVCEEAVSSPSLKSGYTVLGRVDNDVLLDIWLEGATLPTAHAGRAQWFAGSGALAGSRG